MRHLILITVFMLFAACNNGNGDSSQPPVQNPPDAQQDPPGVLAISAYYYTEPPVTGNTDLYNRYLEALQLIRNTGVSGQFQSYLWSELEPAVGVYDNAKLTDFVSTMNSAEQNGLVQLVGLQAINTIPREVPAGLETADWDSNSMVQAFEGLLDQLLPYMQGRVTYLSIGNEVDVYFESGHMGELAAYKTFFNAIQTYLAGRLPEAQLGITITAGGWLGNNVQSWLDLTDSSDVLITTYYPLQPDFSVRPPNAAVADFPNLIALAGNKPLVFQEVGYPSSSVGGSSEALQAEFVRQTFSAWRDANGRIPFLNWFLLHDFSTDVVDELTGYYGINNANFRAYLDSLGLRNRDNTDKQAWPVLLQETEQFRQ